MQPFARWLYCSIPKYDIAPSYTSSDIILLFNSCGYVHTLTDTMFSASFDSHTANTFTSHQMEDDPTIISVYTTPSSFSLPTSSSTVSTLCPACRTGGSTTLNTRWRGARSMPRSATDFFAIGFFFAFCEKQGNENIKKLHRLQDCHQIIIKTLFDTLSMLRQSNLT